MSNGAANNIRSVYLGEGRVGINYGDFYGEPAVFLEPLDHSGPIGDDVSPPLPQDKAKPHSVVIVLKSQQSADVLIDAIRAALLSSPHVVQTNDHATQEQDPPANSKES